MEGSKEKDKDDRDNDKDNNEKAPIQAMEKLQLLQRVVESQKAMAKLTSRCYRKCVLEGSRGARGGGPGKLTKKEKECLWNCAQNFLESSGFIGSRIQMSDDQQG
ncbi:putative mitochondrial import inner membrane translocase subunit TIM8 [Cryptosporidium felis]|nr:putative mitochondrial import inner membrane translocase subunit TIM8 [Cryptosporidium felis]